MAHRRPNRAARVDTSLFARRGVQVSIPRTTDPTSKAAAKQQLSDALGPLARGSISDGDFDAARYRTWYKRHGTDD